MMLYLQIAIPYPGSTRAKVPLRNMTPKEIVLKAKTLCSQDGCS